MSRASLLATLVFGGALAVVTLQGCGDDDSSGSGTGGSGGGSASTGGSTGTTGGSTGTTGGSTGTTGGSTGTTGGSTGTTGGSTGSTGGSTGSTGGSTGTTGGAGGSAAGGTGGRAAGGRGGDGGRRGDGGRGGFTRDGGASDTFNVAPCPDSPQGMMCTSACSRGTQFCTCNNGTYTCFGGGGGGDAGMQMPCPDGTANNMACTTAGTICRQGNMTCACFMDVWRCR